MGKYKIFVDGAEGTTGLQINERLRSHPCCEQIYIAQELRKDPDSRAEMMREADITVFCLPDAAAAEAAKLAERVGARVIDASTVHRTDDSFAYGFAELSAEHRARLAGAQKTANPGCHATGFISLAYPLVRGGILGGDYPFSCFSVTGFSGGGKKLIAAYADPAEREKGIAGVRPYALAMSHKHLPEMVKTCGLDSPPNFTPILGDFYAGMLVSVPVMGRFMKKRLSPAALREYYAEFYAGARFVRVMPYDPKGYEGYLDPSALNGTNELGIYVFGNDENMLVCSRFDNLGKGASGAAVQNMNIMLGLDEGCAL